MKKKLKLRAKIIFSSITIVLIVMLLQSTTNYMLTKNIVYDLSCNNISNIVEGLNNIILYSYRINIERVKFNLEIIYSQVDEKLSIVQNEKVNYNIENQITKEKTQIEIPNMHYGYNDMSSSLECIDNFTKNYGCTATIFQVIPQGLLRVCTSVKRPDGSRAIGTYIPKDSLVWKAISNGETYYGKAFVVDDWYVAGYKPIFNSSKEVIGAIYVGFKIIDRQKIIDYMKSKKIGQSGFLQIFDTNGIQIIHPDDKMVGQVRNNPEHQTMIRQKAGIIQGIQRSSANGKTGIEKIHCFQNIPEIDWISSGSISISEWYDDINDMRNLNIALFVGLLTIVIIFSLLFSRSIIGPIRRVINLSEEISEQLIKNAHDIYTTSQLLSQSSLEQASSLEETSSSINEITSMTHKNAENAIKVDIMMGKTVEIAKKSNESLAKLKNVIEAITSSKEQVARIIKLIDEISFQTNLLALNAAVEAARAGEYGTGFAIVADEVRNLAQKSSDAVKTSSEYLEGSNVYFEEGYTLTKITEEDFQKVMKVLEDVEQLVNEVAIASKEQSLGLNQINDVVSKMELVVQQNAESSSNFTQSSSEMEKQAHILWSVVEEMITLVGKDKKG